MELNSVKFFLEGDTKPPQRTRGNAGCDIFIPNLTEQFIKDLTAKNPGQPFRWGLVGAPATKEEVQKNTGVYIYLPPHEDLLIPTYVKTRFDDNVVLMMTNKSGVATSQKLIVGANTIDSSYQGIIHVHVFNASNNMRFLEFGQKIAQVVPKLFNDKDIEIFYSNEVEAFKEFKNFISVDEFYLNHDSTRKEGGFGSSGLT